MQVLHASVHGEKAPILPILEQLKNDTSKYVLKSLSNNLNDISKDHPELVIEGCKRWIKEEPSLRPVLKHALRSLLKSGNVQALQMFEFDRNMAYSEVEFWLDKNKIKIGESLQMYLSFKAPIQQSVRIEYRIRYPRPSQKFTTKLFFWTELSTRFSEEVNVKKKHSFIDRSIRKHFPGDYTIQVFINSNLVESCELTVWM